MPTKKESRFEIFKREVQKAAEVFGLAHICMDICDYVPEDFPQKDKEDNLSGGMLYRRDQNYVQVFLNPDTDDDPAGTAWHEMAELTLFDLEHFAQNCAKTGKFSKSEWEHQAHMMVNRMVAAARPNITRIIKTSKKKLSGRSNPTSKS